MEIDREVMDFLGLDLVCRGCLVAGMVYYVLFESGPEPRTIEQIAKMRESGTLPDRALVKQGIEGPWLPFNELFEEQVEKTPSRSSRPPPPLPGAKMVGGGAARVADENRTGLLRANLWFIVAVAVLVIIGLSGGPWKDKRILELWGGLATGVTFVGIAKLVKLLMWIKSQGGFNRAWSTLRQEDSVGIRRANVQKLKAMPPLTKVSGIPQGGPTIPPSSQLRVVGITFAAATVMSFFIWREAYIKMNVPAFLGSLFGHSLGMWAVSGFFAFLATRDAKHMLTRSWLGILSFLAFLNWYGQR